MASLYTFSPSTELTSMTAPMALMHIASRRRSSMVSSGFWMPTMPTTSLPSRINCRRNPCKMALQSWKVKISVFDVVDPAACLCCPPALREHRPSLPVHLFDSRFRTSSELDMNLVGFFMGSPSSCCPY